MGNINDKKQKNKPIFAVVIVLAIIIILAAGFISFNGRNKSADNEDYKLKASVNKDCTITPWAVGVEKGFFQRIWCKIC